MNGYLELADFVTGTTKDTGWAGELSKIHPVKYGGQLWRGIRIAEETLKPLMQNKPFSLKTKRSPIVSWSKNLPVAYSFANPSAQGLEGMGIVIKVKVPKKDRLLDLTDKSLQRKLLDEVTKQEGDDFFAKGTIKRMNEEFEVICKYNPSRKYKWCGNVIMVRVNWSRVGKDILELFWDNTTNPDDWVKRKEATFKCDGDGRMTFITGKKET